MHLALASLTSGSMPGNACNDKSVHKHAGIGMGHQHCLYLFSREDENFCFIPPSHEWIAFSFFALHHSLPAESADSSAATSAAESAATSALFYHTICICLMLSACSILIVLGTIAGVIFT